MLTRSPAYENSATAPPGLAVGYLVARRGPQTLFFQRRLHGGTGRNARLEREQVRELGSPPSVEYERTELGRELLPAIQAIISVGTKLVLRGEHVERPPRRRRDAPIAQRSRRAPAAAAAGG